MNSEQFFDNTMFLELLKTALFIGILFFSSSYLLPKGIHSFLKWKRTQEYNDLSMATTCFSLGTLLLAYLLSTKIIDYVKSAL